MSIADDATPRSIRIANMEMADMQKLFDQAQNLDQALEIVTADRDRLAAELRGLITNLDCFDVVANLLLANLPRDNDSYIESEHEGLPSVAELVALMFAEREPRKITGSTQTRGEDLEAVNAKAHQLIRLEARRLHVQLKHDDAEFTESHQDLGEDLPTRVESRMRLSIVTAELCMRSRQYMDKERTLLEGLFGTPTIDAAVREATGYGIADLLALFDLLGARLHEQLGTSFQEARTFIEGQMATNSQFQEAIAQSGREAQEAVDHLVLAAAHQGLAFFGSFSVAELAHEAEINATVIERILTDFSFDTDPQSKDLVVDFLRGDNLVKRRPFASRLDEGERRWFLVQPVSFLFAIRPFLEEALKSTASSNQYTDHRGALLESRGLAELVRFLKPERAYQSVYYQDRSQTQQFEGDGLLLMDRYAIVVEMKSKPLSAESLKGNPGKLFLDLKQIVLAADKQANRLRRLMLDGHPFTLTRATPLDSDGLPLPEARNVEIPLVPGREVLTIVLSLDDLNAVATVVEELGRSGLLEDAAQPPWIVNEHDLEIITEVLERPSEFVHYLLRRQAMDVSSSFRAVEELDYFVHYLKTGLYTDPDEPRSALLMSMTDDLNAWYEFTRGERTVESPKPSQPIPEKLKLLLDALATERPYGWLSISLDLLDFDGEMRREISSIPYDLQEQSRIDRQDHSKFIGLGMIGPGTRRGILFVSFPPGMSEAAALRETRVRLRLKKHSARLAYLAVLGTSQSPKPIDVFAFDDSPWLPDHATDALAQKVGYQIVEPSDQGWAVGRNESP